MDTVFRTQRTSVVKGEKIRFHQTSGDIPCQLLAQDMIIVVKQHETGNLIGCLLVKGLELV
jgi:hypothetical protein